MPVVDLQLVPTTGPAERNPVQAMRCCQARMGIRSPRRGADKGYTAGTSVDVSVSTGFVFTSPESAASAPRLGQPAQAAHGSSPEPRFHIKVEEIFGWRKMIGPP